MADRIVYVQLKTGHDTDAGPSWIGWARFSRTWRSVSFRGRTLRRVTGTAFANRDANFYDVETGEGYWVSGPKRDRTDGRYGHRDPVVEEDARAVYDAFLSGSPLPGRERG